MLAKLTRPRLRWHQVQIGGHFSLKDHRLAQWRRGRRPFEPPLQMYGFAYGVTTEWDASWVKKRLEVLFGGRRPPVHGTTPDQETCCQTHVNKGRKFLQSELAPPSLIEPQPAHVKHEAAEESGLDVEILCSICSRDLSKRLLYHLKPENCNALFHICRAFLEVRRSTFHELRVDMLTLLTDQTGRCQPQHPHAGYGQKCMPIANMYT